MIVGSDVNSEVSRHLQSHVRRCREVWLVKRSTDGAKWGRDVGREDLGWLSATEEQHGAYWTTHSWFLSLVRFRCLFCPYISDIIPYFYNNFSLFYLSQRQRASNERNLTITLSLHYVFNSKNSILSVSRLKTLLPSLSLSLPHPNSSFCSITQHVQWSWSLILLLGKKKALKFVFYFPSSYHLLPRYFRASFLVFLFLVFFFFFPSPWKVFNTCSLHIEWQLYFSREVSDLTTRVPKHLSFHSYHRLSTLGGQPIQTTSSGPLCTLVSGCVQPVGSSGRRSEGGRYIQICIPLVLSLQGPFSMATSLGQRSLLTLRWPLYDFLSSRFWQPLSFLLS